MTRAAAGCSCGRAARSPPSGAAPPRVQRKGPGGRLQARGGRGQACWTRGLRRPSVSRCCRGPAPRLWRMYLWTPRSQQGHHLLVQAHPSAPASAHLAELPTGLGGTLLGFSPTHGVCPRFSSTPWLGTLWWGRGLSLCSAKEQKQSGVWGWRESSSRSSRAPQGPRWVLNTVLRPLNPGQQEVVGPSWSGP